MRYKATEVPVLPGKTGVRAFLHRQTGELRFGVTSPQRLPDRRSLRGLVNDAGAKAGRAHVGFANRHERRFGSKMQAVFTRIAQMMRLKKISLLRERITKPREYPFIIPTIASLDALEISSRVCFFVGENGTGKSTLLEAIAAHYGFGLEGGNRNFSPRTTESVTTIEPLVKALRLSFTKRTGGGFYLRAESFFNVASHVDQVGASGSYGDKSLHDQSHGESFLSLLQNRFTRSGFYLMDEPEAALSPQRQLSFLALLHDLVSGNDDIQFIIATHSPILLAYPGAQIFSFDEGRVHQIDYRESQPFQLVSRFIAAPERYLNALFSELPFSEDQPSPE